MPRMRHPLTRKLIKRGCSEKILRKICRRQMVKISTLLEYERILNLCVSEQNKRKCSFQKSGFRSAGMAARV